MFRLTVHGDDRIARIEPEIYGHFTEHIGGVFYDGIWVGEDSPVPNIRGLRLGLIEKLKAISLIILVLTITSQIHVKAVNLDLNQIGQLMI